MQVEHNYEDEVTVDLDQDEKNRPHDTDPIKGLRDEDEEGATPPKAPKPKGEREDDEDEPKAKAKPKAGDDDDDDLEEYGEKVRKRISKERWKRGQLEKQLEEMQRAVAERDQYLQYLAQQASQSDDWAVSSREEAIKSEYAATQRALREALDAGDSEKMVAAQERITDLRMEHRQIEMWKRQRQGQQPQQQQPQQEWQGQPQQQYQPQQQVQQGPDELAMDWASSNDWFGQDPVKTGAAYALDAALKQEGYDPRTKDFYAELDSRLRTYFPDLVVAEEPPKRQGQQHRQGNAQPVAGVTRNPAAPRSQVKLNAREVEMARKLGVPLEEYARYKR